MGGLPIASMGKIFRRLSVVNVSSSLGSGLTFCYYVSKGKQGRCRQQRTPPAVWHEESRQAKMEDKVSGRPLPNNHRAPPEHALFLWVDRPGWRRAERQEVVFQARYSG